MRTFLLLIACAAAATAEPQCVLSDWSEWSDCVAPASSRCGRSGQPMSFPAEKPGFMEVDMGRLMFHGMMLEKERIWQAIDAATADGSCEACQPKASIRGAMVPCVNGFAGEYNCNNIDLMSLIGFADLGYEFNPTESYRGNDIWGWTDPLTNNEYAIMGMRAGTSFVDITDPVNPVVVGYINTQNNVGSNWRDMKVINNHVYIGSEAGGHGMQVFDLTFLRGRTGIVEFQPTVHYGNFGQSHNIVANPQTSTIFAVGINTDGVLDQWTTCSGGLHMIDVSDPVDPVFAGCYSDDGYTHDAQCVLYYGPDSRYTGREICFNLNEDTVTIVDVTNRNNPQLLARQGYQGAKYTHQGWLTEEQDWFIVNDELDEDENTVDKRTRSYVWDVRDLTAPVLVDVHIHDTTTIDHNLYNLGGLSYMSNYQAGLRIMDFSNPPSMTEVAYFDVYPIIDESTFGHGAWSVYPFFKSGNIVISSIDYGLFVVRPNMAAIEALQAQNVKKAPMGERTRFRKLLAKDFGATCGEMSETEQCLL